MTKCIFPNCSYEGAPEYCFRHKPKGQPKEVKPKKPIKQVSDKKQSKAGEEKERKERLTKFFNDMLNIAPFHCQECGVHLGDSTRINVRSIVCHLLPKKTFLSVDCEPNNIVYLCNLHHGRLDNNLENAMKEFTISPLIKDKIKLLIPFLTPQEVSKIPSYYLTT